MTPADAFLEVVRRKSDALHAQRQALESQAMPCPIELGRVQRQIHTLLHLPLRAELLEACGHAPFKLDFDFQPEDIKSRVGDDVLTFISRLLPVRCLWRVKVYEGTLPSNVHGFYNAESDGFGAITLDSKRATVRTFIHEVGHHVEYTMSLHAEARKWQARGIALPSSYSYKTYEDGATELVSTLLEYLWLNPLDLARQYRRLFNWLIGVLEC